MSIRSIITFRCNLSLPLTALVALLALASGGFAGRIAWVRNQRSRRYTPADANLVPVGAWAEVTDRLAMRRHLPRAAETAHEFARRAETETGLATLEPLSDLAAAGTFGDTPLDDDQVEQSRRLATSASTALTSEWSRTDRLRWMLGLIPSGRGRPGPG